MAGGNESGTWDRVAAELRACREAQQQAWGDIDNATLGRYLAGDVSGEERRRVEKALTELPVLRKLVDLVGDVLSDFEPADEPVVPEPAVLSFPPRTTRRRFLSQVQRRTALVAAACMLLALGLFLSREFTSPSAGPHEVARVIPVPPAALPEPKSALRDVPAPPLRASASLLRDQSLDHALEVELAQAKRSAESLEQQGRKDEARKLVERAAAEVNQRAVQLRKEGQLARAEPLLAAARDVCEQKLGLDHPETQASLQNLAFAYRDAVNSWSPDGKALAYSNAAGPASRSDTPVYGVHPEPPAPALAPPTPGAVARFQNKSEDAEKDERPKEVALDLGIHLDRQSPRQWKAQVVPVLTQALKKASTPKEREAWARTLAHLGPVARDSVPVLTECLQKATEPGERQALLVALGEMGPAAEPAAPVLVDALRYDNPETRRCAGEAIVRMGPGARYAVPALSRRAQAKDEVAQDVLRRIQGHEGRIGVADTCDCFSLLALRSSLRQIHTLAATTGVEVLVETVPTLTADKKADERARDLGVRGVYLLVAHDTLGVQVSVSEPLRKQGLTADRVRAAVEPPLRNKDFDGALREGVRVVARFEETLRDKKTP